MIFSVSPLSATPAKLLAANLTTDPLMHILFQALFVTVTLLVTSSFFHFAAEGEGGQSGGVYLLDERTRSTRRETLRTHRFTTSRSHQQSSQVRVCVYACTNNSWGNHTGCV